MIDILVVISPDEIATVRFEPILGGIFFGEAEMKFLWRRKAKLG